MDELINRQASAVDPAERVRLFREVQRVFSDHLPAMYFAAPRLFVAVGPRVRNETPGVLRPQLLWSADINMVRGEDSLVRALWAGKPLVWDIYKQNDGVHWDKLKAFTQRYGASGDEGVAQLNDAFTLCWNDSQVAASELTQQWLRYVRAMPALTQHARDVAAHLAQQDDLVTQLLRHLSVAEKP